MPLPYSEVSRRLQDRFDTRRLADRLNEVKVHDEFTDSDREFIAAQAIPQGRRWLSGGGIQ